MFTISVRSPASESGAEGASAMVTLTMQQMEELAASIIRANTGTAV